MKPMIKAGIALGALVGVLFALVVVSSGDRTSLLNARLVSAHSAGSGGSYSVTVSPAGPYSFSEKVYTTTNAPVYPNNTGPWLELTCYQNGVVVASGDHAGFPDGWYYNWPWDLGPTQSWAGGAADCTVKVFHQSHNKLVTDATTSFHVNG
jgi:hypothetical protein